MQKEFKISVVIPIYNVEEYIEEALDSVINQTLGFEENIQMVLVNDGSSDSSGEICERYEKKYPQNIKYFYKENGGVSSARNMGIDYAVGKYLTFLTPMISGRSTRSKMPMNFLKSIMTRLMFLPQE